MCDFNLPQLSSSYNSIQEIDDSVLKLISSLISYSFGQIVISPTIENNILYLVFCSQIKSHDEILNLLLFS